MITFCSNFSKCCIHIDQDCDQSDVELNFDTPSVEPDVDTLRVSHGSASMKKGVHIRPTVYCLL